jgi:guanylate kinase
VDITNSSPKKGLFIVVSAPSGCGKGTILRQILRDDNYYYSVSATTRSPRTGEIDGRDYHFISKDDFQQLIYKKQMLEFAEYCGNYYGTPKKAIDEKLAEGKNVILEIEVQGAMQVKKLVDDAVFIFIAPPSVDELRRRLNKRGTESDEVIEGRINQALTELEKQGEYDYIIVNDELEVAVEDFKSIARSEKLKAFRNI